MPGPLSCMISTCPSEQVKLHLKIGPLESSVHPDTGIEVQGWNRTVPREGRRWTSKEQQQTLAAKNSAKLLLSISGRVCFYFWQTYCGKINNRCECFYFAEIIDTQCGHVFREIHKTHSSSLAKIKSFTSRLQSRNRMRKIAQFILQNKERFSQCSRIAKEEVWLHEFDH